MTFKALVAREGTEGMQLAVEERSTDELPAGELLVRVEYSSLNYKDALSASGNRGVTKRFPHTPGIDAAGVVAESSVSRFREGDEVVITGYDLGMNTPGGFGEYIRVPAAWAVGLPMGLSAREAMIYGTAGLTAAIAVSKLEAQGIGQGRFIVTGAKGGVGSMALAILAANGREVDAVTGTPQAADYLRSLGAKEIVARSSLAEESSRPLLHARWAGAVDAVGGAVLSTLLRSIDPGGAVAACGNVASGSFDGSVYPFILRGISLLGVDSANYPLEGRRSLWERLAGPWRILDRPLEVAECPLDALAGRIEAMKRGELRGRLLVNLAS